jgi:uncharacterized protein
MKNSVIINTSKQLKYLYAPKNKEYLLVPPQLADIIEKKGSKNKYFQKKYSFLKKHKYFDGIEQKESIDTRFSKKDAIQAFLNDPSITFEVTENCNLKCDYCYYRELYTGYDFRNGKQFSLENAIKIIDEVLLLLFENTHKNDRAALSIGFYGGEPLLNFKFIEDVVAYLEIKKKYLTINYGITTNTTLIDRNIDFLVKYNFNVLVSLDGNYENNAYRNFHSGKSSFKKVYDNILMIKDKYPNFYHDNIHFNVVYHNLNSDLDDLYDFFWDNFSKTPLIEPISPENVSASDKVDSKSVDFNSSLKTSKYFKYFKEKRLMNIPEILDFNTIIKQTNKYSFHDYKTLLFSDLIKKSHTGTCTPFSKKLFITSSGKLLSCENIPHKHALGNINKTNFKLNWDAAMIYYNEVFDAFSEQCASCYKADICDACIFNENELSKDSSKPVCKTYTNKKRFRKELEYALKLYNMEPKNLQAYHTS